MDGSKFQIIISIQLLILVIDLLINSCADLFRRANVFHLILFIIEDLLIIFAMITLFLMFFNTYIFQAGFVGLLVNKFCGTILITFIYLALSISFHVWKITLHWQDTDRYIWNNGLLALYVCQKIAALYYYYYYKRTAMLLGDKKFYVSSDWIEKELSKK